jgi:hypothetical protein
MGLASTIPSRLAAVPSTGFGHVCTSLPNTYPATLTVRLRTQPSVAVPLMAQDVTLIGPVAVSGGNPSATACARFNAVTFVHAR